MGKAKSKKKSATLTALANFIYEVGILNRTPRSGLWFLGSGEQSVAEHLLRTAYIAYILSHRSPKADAGRVIFMSLVHDLGEGRTSDLNYVHQHYGRLAETNALKDLAKTLPFGGAILEAYREEQAAETVEARLVKDADKLEWIATLREEEVRGNRKARLWIKRAFSLLGTTEGKHLGRALLAVHPDQWWAEAQQEVTMVRRTKMKAAAKDKHSGHKTP